MAGDEFNFNSGQTPAQRPKFRIVSLFFALTLFAILLGWYVDHNRLREQLPPPAKKRLVSYRLLNASPKLAAKKLQELFGLNAIPISRARNSLIINTDDRVHQQVRFAILHIDRKDTEFVDLESSNAPTSESN